MTDGEFAFFAMHDLATHIKIARNTFDILTNSFYFANEKIMINSDR